jgi:hypothetical protein
MRPGVAGEARGGDVAGREGVEDGARRRARQRRRWRGASRRRRAGRRSPRRRPPAASRHPPSRCSTRERVAADEPHRRQPRRLGEHRARDVGVVEGAREEGLGASRRAARVARPRGAAHARRRSSPRRGRGRVHTQPWGKRTASRSPSASPSRRVDVLEVGRTAPLRSSPATGSLRSPEARGDERLSRPVASTRTRATKAPRRARRETRARTPRRAALLEEHVLGGAALSTSAPSAAARRSEQASSKSRAGHLPAVRRRRSAKASS